MLDLPLGYQHAGDAAGVLAEHRNETRAAAQSAAAQLRELCQPIWHTRRLPDGETALTALSRAVIATKVRKQYDRSDPGPLWARWKSIGNQAARGALEIESAPHTRREAERRQVQARDTADDPNQGSDAEIVPLENFITCCSQVMDADGGGMEFVAYNVGAARDLDNPHLTRDEMRAVMARSAHLYQRRHAGRLPTRLSVHKTIGWRAEEIMGVLDAWPAADVECITVQTSTPWRAVGLDPGATSSQSVPAQWPVQRGTLQQLSTHSALLWITGTTPGMSLRRSNYNPAVKGIPTPTLIRRDAGHGPLEQTAEDLLALSKLDWNNDAPFDQLPVTLSYSQRLATVIGHVPELPDNVYQYRLFM